MGGKAPTIEEIKYPDFNSKTETLPEYAKKLFDYLQTLPHLTKFICKSGMDDWEILIKYSPIKNLEDLCKLYGDVYDKYAPTGQPISGTLTRKQALLGLHRLQKWYHTEQMAKGIFNGSEPGLFIDLDEDIKDRFT